MSTPDYEAQQKAREQADADARQLEKDVAELQRRDSLSAEDADARGQQLQDDQARVTQGDAAARATEVDLPPAGDTGTAQPLEEQPDDKPRGGKQRK